MNRQPKRSAPLTEPAYTSKTFTKEKKQLEGWPIGPALLRYRNGFHYEFLEKGMNDMHKNLTDVNLTTQA